MREADILARMQKMTPHYTPEWHMGGDDVGNAFASVFADLFAETWQRYNSLMDKHHIEFLNAAGVRPLEKQAAEGLVVFSLASGAPEGCLVPAETEVFTHDDVVYTTTAPVFVSTARMTCVYSCMEDSLYQEGDGTTPLTLFDKTEDLQTHHLFVTHPWLFDVAQGAQITLLLHGEHVHMLGDPTLVEWSYYNQDWIPFREVTIVGNRMTVTPHAPLCQTVVNDNESFYLRARALQPAVDAVRLTSITADVASTCACTCYHEDVELSHEGFFPFGKSLSPFAECHVACSEAFGKPDADITLSFRLESITQEILNPLPVIPPRWRSLMHQQEFDPPPTYAVEVLDVGVEYWNGLDFVRLPNAVSTLFCTTDRIVLKTLTFRCPTDMCVTVMHGLESRWLRFRLLDIANALKPNAYHVVPFVRDIQVSYCYATPRLPCSYISHNNLAWATADKVFDFRHLQERTIYMGLDRPIGGSPLGIFCEVDHYQMDCELRWETYQNGQWKPHLSDGTIWQTGLLTLTLNDPMVATTVFGKAAYWLRAQLTAPTNALRTARLAPLTIRTLLFGAVAVVQKSKVHTQFVSLQPKDTTKLIPLDMARLTDMTVSVDISDQTDPTWVAWQETDPNSFRLLPEGVFFDKDALRRLSRHKESPVIQLTYRWTDGRRGICAAGQIHKMNTSVGYINGVTNPLPLVGGRDTQPPDSILQRSADMLIHGGQAVTAAGFESILYDAYADMITCKCYTRMGAVLLVYLCEDEYNPEQRNARLTQYIAERCAPQVQITVRHAIRISISVHAQILVHPNNFANTRETIERGLTAFLHPVTGNFRGIGFAIGEIPKHHQFTSFLHSFAGVRDILQFSISAISVDDHTRQEVDIQALPQEQLCIPVSGIHRIDVVSER